MNEITRCNEVITEKNAPERLCNVPEQLCNAPEQQCNDFITGYRLAKRFCRVFEVETILRFLHLCHTEPSSITGSSQDDLFILPNS